MLPEARFRTPPINTRADTEVADALFVRELLYGPGDTGFQPLGRAGSTQLSARTGGSQGVVDVRRETTKAARLGSSANVCKSTAAIVTAILI